ncbi:FAD-dependent oxidoreductase [Halobacillus sp. BBL2006]|uniref:FAD-dependent oxidoreductase n=1 Tax=Halobacillus sp. BBL2006 TaxID=1543706 RepID=UPI0005433904|nr:FAD-dependent oxidoreductase [Halobacillus sp. BBL2006]KHE71897.1 pyridine nucleotide-disulfide oxidoreductase [Halobacillus sp. BBL2006]
MSKRLLLVGAGHAHLEVLRQLKEESMNDVDICLISPSDYQYYSGMFSGYTEGLYSKEETRVNIRKLAKETGVHFIRKMAKKILPDHHKLICMDGAVYPFDVISFDIGSRSLPPDFFNSVAKSIKPNYHFIDYIEEIRQTSQPLIVGGGAAGTELALSIQAYKERNRLPGQVRLITSETILPGSPSWISNKMKDLLMKKGIQVWENERVQEVEDHYIKTDFGNKVRHTGVLWLGGALSDQIFRRSGTEVDEKGFALVRSTLQFHNYDYLFGAGDCVTMSDHPELPKSGVYAVKQGPVLFENLKNYLTGEPLTDYSPQKNAMYILSTGRKKGFLIYGPLVHHSHRAWKVKNKIDREFMEKYQ